MHAERSGTSAAFANSAEAGLLLLLFLAAAIFSMLPTTRSLLALWTGDPLRSFGGLLPFVSIGLIVRAWRQTGWRFAPHPAGLAAILLAIAASRLSEGLQVSYRFRTLSIDPLQPALLVFLFFSGAILLLGGPHLFRRSLFPLLLLLCLNPVPHLFTTWVDFPLQRMSAEVARRFAHLLGLYPTGQQLQLMFTPKFGMEIIPGCNGMRGAATMAYLTVVLAYLRGYRPARIALLATLATLLGYLLNFLRLCLLVVYYAIGSNHPALRGNGVLIDYIIGGCIFLVVSTLAGALWLRGDTAPPRSEHPVPWPKLLRQPTLLASAAVLVLASASELPAASTLIGGSGLIAPERAFDSMPVAAGVWTRSSTFAEESLHGTPTWTWATYRHPDGRTVDFGIWLQAGQHFALHSRQMQGIEPLWTGVMETHAAGSVPVELSEFVAVDEVGSNAGSAGFFSETTCLTSRCASHVIGFPQQGWSVASGPAAMRTTLRLPMQFRVLHRGTTTLSAAVRAADEAAIRDLLHSLQLPPLVQTLGFR